MFGIQAAASASCAGDEGGHAMIEEVLLLLVSWGAALHLYRT
jgi:hypothetical protein